MTQPDQTRRQQQQQPEEEDELERRQQQQSLKSTTELWVQYEHQLEDRKGTTPNATPNRATRAE